MALESKFQAILIEQLREIFPEAIILKNDPNYLQGFPDLLILVDDKWAALETKRQELSSRRPNQDYYVRKLNEMSYSAFVSPENERQVLHELQQALRSSRSTRISWS